MELEGRVAIVTGGRYGIGKAIALARAQEGADVAVAARTESAAITGRTINIDAGVNFS